MNLMTLIRLVALLAVAWVLLAMGAGMLGVGARSTGSPAFFFLKSLSHDAVAIPHPEDRSKEEYRLVDRTTGRIEPLSVPPDQKWGLLSVSPWRDQEGNLEAAGRWVNRLDGSEQPAFCGVGLFRISDGTVLDLVKLDILPTGRPCFIPGRPREFLFPAGDGRLHRCRLGGDRPQKTQLDPRENGRRLVRSARSLQPIEWRCTPPGPGETVLADPVWPTDGALSRFVIVSLRRQTIEGARKAYEQSKIWWLEMSEEADAIVAAGRLTLAGSSRKPDDLLVEGYPSVSAGSGGQLTLNYLARRTDTVSWQLCRAILEIDQKTGKPVLAPNSPAAEILGEGLAPSPVVPLEDGRSVYASAGAGQIVKYPLTGSR
jgi:hypothetical protein